MRHPISRNKQLLLMALILVASSLVRWNVAWGSHMCIFSLASILGPMLGLVGTASTLLVVLVATSLLKFAGVAVSSSFVLSSYGLPTLAAALCWRLYDCGAVFGDGSSFYSSYLLSSVTVRNIAGFYLKVIVPLVCMFLYMGHASSYAPYALYWLIPVAVFMIEWLTDAPSSLGRLSLLLPALSSTFIAHAIGSVIWMYVVPMTPMQWAALIPVVALERLVFASGMVICGLLFASHQSIVTAVRTVLFRARKGVLGF